MGLKGCFYSEFPFLPWRIVLYILCAGICCVSTILCCRESDRSSGGSRTPQSFTAVVNDTPAPKPWYHPQSLGIIEARTYVTACNPFVNLCPSHSFPRKEQFFALIHC